MKQEPIIDINIDFTQDTKDCWKNWWSHDKGDELTGTREVPDPDGHSKLLCSYHQILWSKRLPDGEMWNLIAKKNAVVILKGREAKK